MESGPVANPMTRYPRYAAYRPSWTPTWSGFGCLVEAEDGSWGFATASHGRPVAAIIDDYLGPRLEGESCLATEKCYDMMLRMGAPHGAAGLHSYAVSAIDLALWDLKGKLLQRPVYELIGGPARDELFCYSTGGDTDWYMELGFRATKLPCPYGPADGLEGLRKNVELVAGTRELVGVEVDEEAVERFRVPQETLDEHASRGELFIHPKPRLINAVVYPDGTCIYMDGLAAPGTYVEGVRTEILDDDGSKEWRELHERVQREGQVVSRWEG